MIWRRPLLWAVVAWTAGMAAASAYAPGWTAAGVAAAGLAAAAAQGGSVRRSASAALLVAAAFAAGVVRFELAERSNVSAIAPPDGEGKPAVIAGVIVSKPEVDGDRLAFDVAAAAATIEARESELSGERIRVYVRLETEAEAERARSLRRGETAEVAGELRLPSSATNFGGFDYRLYLARQHTFWTLRADGLAALRRIGEAEGAFAAKALDRVDRVREHMGARLEALFTEPTAGFMKGLLLGVRDDLDPEQFQAFSQIGLTHILAISGLHVAIYVGALLWLLGKLPLSRERRLELAMAAVPVYVVLTGMSPSVVRAGLMAAIALYAARRRLLKDGLHILAAAALLMLLWEPYYLYNVSFQLSFAVTAGLIIFTPRAMELLRAIRPQPLRSAVAVTLVAQCVSFPLTITYFNGFSWLSFPANFLLVPAFSFAVLPLGTAALLLAYVAPPVAPWAAYLAEKLTALCFLAVERLSGWESASTIWATPPAWWIAAYYALLLAATSPELRRRPGFGRFAAAACAAALAGLLAYAYAPDALDRAGYVSFLDVGQGDAILLRTPSGAHWLVDGGGTIRFERPGEEWRRRSDPFEVGEDVLVPLLKRRGVQSIDALFVSHADTDHIGGLSAVLEHIPVRRIFFNGTVKSGEASERFYRTALSQGVPLIPMHAGMTVEAGGAKAVAVYPTERGPFRVEEEQNEASLVLLATMYSRTFLLTGDIGEAEEREIVSGRSAEIGAGSALPRIDVLKAAHHGSKSSTLQRWLDAWRPRVAVVSAGRNNIYGHPHPSVLQRLDDNGIPALRTDQHGEIQFRVEADAWQVRTKLPR
ncbi:DNA internalization-related competence protein ComEC/Rec2 [Paenibacillus sp.]|uniref:DNA internalization-related competence protein ComEC/Rec2 n=1 Tax=Paenibacillus sp. TaxID=58172 RepID=UPI002D4C164B|nr:DNA internalization-related competence protein ComEC/Rec2 [Paenibacillus sp.]HZG84131.1 DNA internalization-related competence protein ComEC/Rec2 [Paenibacillus sp.]